MELLVGGLCGGLAVVAAISAVEAVWICRGMRGWGELAPPVNGVYGADHGGSMIRLAVLGDSNAAGVGMARAAQTLPVLLARGLAAGAGRPVELTSSAVSGADSADLDSQLDYVFTTSGPPQVAVIVIGGNDLIHRRLISRAVHRLYETVENIRAAGGEVIVATCPDLGAIPLIIAPLRYLAGWMSRLLAALQTIVVLRAGGQVISVGNLLGPLLRGDPARMFAADHFHVSPLGYAHAVRILLPSVVAAARKVAGEQPEVG